MGSWATYAIPFFVVLHAGRCASSELKFAFLVYFKSSFLFMRARERCALHNAVSMQEAYPVFCKCHSLLIYSYMSTVGCLQRLRRCALNGKQH